MFLMLNVLDDVLNSGFFLFKQKNVGKAHQLEANQLRESILTKRYRRKLSKASDKLISEAEEKLATGRYTAQEFLQIVSQVTEESFEIMADEEKNQENSETDEPFMTSDDPLQYFEIKSDEDETDCKKCCAWELGKINFRAKPCEHLMCTFCIEEDECLECHTKFDSKFAIFFELWVIIMLFRPQLIFQVSSVLPESLDVFWSILAFWISFS